MSKYITNLVENPKESPYGLISVYNMVYRVYGKETANKLNSDPEIKEKYHKKIYSLYSYAKENNWYKGLTAEFNVPSTHGGDKTNRNTKYTKWWLEKQVKKYDPLTLLNKNTTEQIKEPSILSKDELPF